MKLNQSTKVFGRRVAGWSLLVGMAMTVSMVTAGEPQSGAATGIVAAAELERLVGQPADIASSAYQYRADRRPEENPPESWLALMRYANVPLNKPVDVTAPACQQVLCGLLWEEIRPVGQLELTWPPDARRRPAPEDLVITTLDPLTTASSWWNNLGAAAKAVKPSVAADGNRLLYDLQTNTCGIVVSIAGGKCAADFSVPAVRVLVADTWKKMDFEIEWGYEESAADKDYSGRIEIYDGRVSNLRPLNNDGATVRTTPCSWRSPRSTGARRGVAASLLYMGTAKWRQTQPFTSQRDDVARTIVTVWTESGNFSFLAADLENGPILAPEYGFFVRRTSEPPPPATTVVQDLRVPRSLLAEKMLSIAGSPALLGWGSDATPWFGGNAADAAVAVQGITIPARSLAMHPGPAENVAVGWRSPIEGNVKVTASVAHGQSGSNGIDWWIARNPDAADHTGQWHDRRTRCGDDSHRPDNARFEQRPCHSWRHDLVGRGTKGGASV